MPESGGMETKLYKKRYFMLVMFIVLSASNAMQWIEYSIIAHIITDFYSGKYHLNICVKCASFSFL